MEALVLVRGNEEGKRILEFCKVLDLVLGNTLFMKGKSDVITHRYGIDKNVIDYLMVRIGDRSLLKMS
jgi:rRNA maturation protein Rpf1